MVPTRFQIQNSRIFQGPFLCMLKKWLADYTNKFRPEGMKNATLEFLLLFLSCISGKLQYCRKYEMYTYSCRRCVTFLKINNKTSEIDHNFQIQGIFSFQGSAGTMYIILDCLLD